MKIFLSMLVLAFIVPCYLKAQDATLGKSKEQIREMVRTNTDIKVSRGDSCDTLTMLHMPGNLQTFMFYKNDICYASKSVMPLKFLNMIKDKMTTDSFKKIKENVWINHSGTVRIEITIITEKDQFTVETSQVDGGVPN